MQFYKIVFHTIPKIQFAHSYRTTNYDMSFNRAAGNMEICYIKEGTAERISPDGSRLIAPSPSIGVQIYTGERIRCKSDAPLHIHYTFGLRGEWSAYPHSAEEILACMQSGFLPSENYPLCVLLPMMTDDIKCTSTLEPCFHEIVTAHKGYSPFRTVSCMQQVFRIFSVLTDWSIAQAVGTGQGILSPANISYCRRAIEYIETHIHRPCTVEEIANDLQISPAHLSRIFKAVTGSAPLDYMNRMKIHHARQLLEAQDMPLREVAAQIGIRDEKYFLRLFKKYTGMTTGTFKKNL